MQIVSRNSLLTTIITIVICTTTISCTNNKSYRPERIKSEVISVNNSVSKNQELSDFIKPYKNAIQLEMDSILAYAPASYSKKDSKYNTAVGNMMADAIYEIVNPVFQKRAGYPFDAVLLNYGGIRSALNKGPVTTRTAYELMPFENEVVVVELSGKQLNEMFKYLKQGVAHPLSGIQFELNGDGSIKKAQIQGRNIVENETYFIATSDYLKNGGDNMTFFSNPISILSLDYKIRNVLIDYFKKKDTIAPTTDNRFTKDSK